MMLNFGSDDWVWQGWNCMKLKFVRQLRVQLKAIGIIRTKIKSVRS
jgi:hypothetical protein